MFRRTAVYVIGCVHLYSAVFKQVSEKTVPGNKGKGPYEWYADALKLCGEN